MLKRFLNWLRSLREDDQDPQVITTPDDPNVWLFFGDVDAVQAHVVWTTWVKRGRVDAQPVGPDVWRITVTPKQEVSQ